jgi:Uma2 family endonuclease
MHLGVEEYLEAGHPEETKGEPLDSEGASFRHNVIAANLIGELRQQLKGRPCTITPGDLRVHISETGLSNCPDLVAICGEPRFEDQELETLLNPTLIIEVLSPATEAYDRGKKFEHYRTIESLAEYVLVSQERPRIEQFVRQEGDRWLFTATPGLDGRVILPSVGCELALAEVYDKVQLGRAV